MQSEEKISCNLDSINKAKRIFTLMGLKNWCTKKITAYVFKKGEMELLVQEVEDFGLFIEIEQFQSQSDSSKKALNKLIKFVKDMQIPIKQDYYVSIAYMMYLKNFEKKPPKPKAKPEAKEKEAK